MNRYRITQPVPLPDDHDDGEVLVPGIVTGARVTLLTGEGRLDSEMKLWI